MKKLLSNAFSIYWFIINLLPTILGSLIIFISVQFIPSAQKRGRYIRKYIRIWAKITIWSSFSSVKLIREAKEIPKNCIVISNHLAAFDIFTGSGFYPVDFIFFAKAKIFDIPVIGHIMRLSKYIPIHRESVRKSAQAVLMSIRELKNGENVLIYPEGTRNLEAKSILPFKSGILLICQKIDIPILPIVIFGTNQVCDGDNILPSRPGKIKIKVLEPIYRDNKIHPANKNSKLTGDEKLTSMHHLMEKEYSAFMKGEI